MLKFPLLCGCCCLTQRGVEYFWWCLSDGQKWILWFSTACCCSRVHYCSASVIWFCLYYCNMCYSCCIFNLCSKQGHMGISCNSSLFFATLVLVAGCFRLTTALDPSHHHFFSYSCLLWLLLSFLWCLTLWPFVFIFVQTTTVAILVSCSLFSMLEKLQNYVFVGCHGLLSGGILLDLHGWNQLLTHLK